MRGLFTSMLWLIKLKNLFIDGSIKQRKLSLRYQNSFQAARCHAVASEVYPDSKGLGVTDSLFQVLNVYNMDTVDGLLHLSRSFASTLFLQ